MYLWRFKKKEQVDISGPHSTPKLDKKRKKKISQVPQGFGRESFEFEDNHPVWEELLKERVDAFTASSSFVGQVIYDSDSQDMKITLSGESYVFCGVDSPTFEQFKGANSKGSFFNSRIKGNFDC